jgi:hydrogenase nickel incorporation protein HypA/HybF
VSGVEPALFETAFSLCREGVLADAELEIKRVEAAWSCPACGGKVAAEGPLRCEPCGEAARLSGGDELVLEQIEMEVP